MVRTLLRGECHATPWSPWSPCEGPCGTTSTAVRSRAILHRPHARHLAADEPCPHGERDEKPCVVRCRDGHKTSGGASVGAAAAAKLGLDFTSAQAAAPPLPEEEEEAEELAV